jgi:DNA-binding response OmpR family regulator
MRDNILLVEDEEALRMALGDRLRKEGYTVECAPDGETGFQKATSLPFDLMILDIMLPGRSGLDLCRDIRSVGLGTPILMLTACHQPEVKIAGFKAGADDYVTKPFNMLELDARVEALLRRTPAGEATQLAEYSGAALAADPDSPVYHSTFRNSDLRAELHKRVTAQKDSPLVDVIPQLRKMLDEEQHNPQTPRNTSLLSVAEGVIQFLEEIFEDVRSPMRRR